MTRPFTWTTPAARATAPPAPAGPPRPGELLRVELDDELLLDLGVDDLPGRQAVHQDLQLAGDRLQPRRYRLRAGLGGRHDERRQVAGLLPYLDDVVVADPVRRDVDLLAVDQEVAVLDQLPAHVPGLRVPGPVDHVVQPRLEDLQQYLTGLARLAYRLVVVPLELLLQYAVDPAGLLLLAKLEQVLGLLRPAAA